MSDAHETFISYQHTDEYAAKALKALLSAYDQSVFLDQFAIGAGVRWREEIDSAARRATRLIVMWSRSAANSSEVKREIDLVVSEAERLGIAANIIPVCLDGAPVPDVLARYQVIRLTRSAAVSARVKALVAEGKSQLDAGIAALRELRSDGAEIRIVEVAEILLVLELFEGITDLATRVVRNAVAAGMAGASPIGEVMQGSIDAVGKGIGGAVDVAGKTVAELGKGIGDAVKATGKTIADVAGFFGIKS
jgi:TIR domain